ncbi:MAG: ATP-binding protein [Candidatus Neomarinimicrobiota bacterium]
MIDSIIVGLLQNVAVLLTFCLVYDYIWKKDKEIQTVPRKVLAGVLIGSLSLLLMLTPYHLSAEIMIDSRTVLLAISGLFFGFLPTIIAMCITVLYQFTIEGNSLLIGVAFTLIAGFCGLTWRQFFPPREIKKPFYCLFILALLVHLLELASVLLFLKNISFSDFKEIAIPLVLLYPAFTVLLGMLFLSRWRIWQHSQETRQEELQYRALFENAGEAIVIAQKGKISFANKRMTDILGVPPDESRRKAFTSFVHPDDRDLVYQRHLKRIKKLDVPSRYSFRMITKQNKLLWVDINSVYFEWNGEPASLSFLSDVTEHREAERQLILAKNKAEESDRIKSIFLANMSHEIRTPMNAIVGFSDLLSKDSLSEAKRKPYFEMIHSAGKQLLHIINDIIDVSKLEVNQLRLNKENVRLDDIFKQSIDMFQSSSLFIEKKNVELILNFPSPTKEFMVYADPYRIRQILDNLLSNAIKYSNTGSVELGYTLTEKARSLVLFTYVKDTGPGIPEDKKTMVFKRFRQVEEDRYREGTGLGLSITKGIIDLMGGEIDLESQVGVGSKFFFSLELEKAKELQLMDNNEINAIPDLKDINIYIAEDDYTSFFLIKEYLNETNARISYAYDGEILMEMLEKEVPDILLLDINMPKKDGYACLEEIKNKNYSVKIIAQTAYAMENEKDRCLASGCHGYVSKPIDALALYKEIQKVLQR